MYEPKTGFYNNDNKIDLKNNYLFITSDYITISFGYLRATIMMPIETMLCSHLATKWLVSEPCEQNNALRHVLQWLNQFKFILAHRLNALNEVYCHTFAQISS